MTSCGNTHSSSSQSEQGLIVTSSLISLQAHFNPLTCLNPESMPSSEGFYAHSSHGEKTYNLGVLLTV